MTSTAYRQASRRDPALDAIDPDNRLLGRMSVRRLEAEAVRDAILAVSGKLDPTMFGPPVAGRPGRGGPGAHRQGHARLGRAAHRPAGLARRCRVPTQPLRPGPQVAAARLHRIVRRPVAEPELRAPGDLDGRAPVARPDEQRVLLRAATDAAERVARIAGADPSARVRHAWRLALSREPDDEQVAEAVAFLGEQREEFARTPMPPATKAKGEPDSPEDPDLLALATFFQALFGSNGFLYVD